MVNHENFIVVTSVLIFFKYAGSDIDWIKMKVAYQLLLFAALTFLFLLD
jgi:hypothetical protein